MADICHTVHDDGTALCGADVSGEPWCTADPCPHPACEDCADVAFVTGEPAAAVAS